MGDYRWGCEACGFKEPLDTLADVLGIPVPVKPKGITLEDYAQEKGLQRNDPLFASRKGGHITKQRADQIIRRATKRARIERNVHAHLFRHGYAINFLNCGGRLDALQEQLGHRDINTTRIYLRLSDEDVKREVGKVQF